MGVKEEKCEDWKVTGKSNEVTKSFLLANEIIKK